MSYVGILSNQFVLCVLSNLKYKGGERAASPPFLIVHFFVKVRLLRTHDSVCKIIPNEVKLDTMRCSTYDNERLCSEVEVITTLFHRH